MQYHFKKKCYSEEGFYTTFKLTFLVWVALKTEKLPIKLKIGCHGNRAEILLLWTLRMENGGVCVCVYVREKQGWEWETITPIPSLLPW